MQKRRELIPMIFITGAVCLAAGIGIGAQINGRPSTSASVAAAPASDPNPAVLRNADVRPSGKCLIKDDVTAEPFYQVYLLGNPTDHTLTYTVRLQVAYSDDDGEHVVQEDGPSVEVPSHADRGGAVFIDRPVIDPNTRVLHCSLTATAVK